jgi:hypothetical protein
VISENKLYVKFYTITNILSYLVAVFDLNLNFSNFTIVTAKKWCGSMCMFGCGWISHIITHNTSCEWHIVKTSGMCILTAHALVMISSCSKILQTTLTPIHCHYIVLDLLVVVSMVCFRGLDIKAISRCHPKERTVRWRVNRNGIIQTFVTILCWDSCHSQTNTYRHTIFC